MVVVLWTATFLFARRRRAASKTAAFYLGTFVVWPAMSFSFGRLIAEQALEGIDKSVGPGVVYLFGFAIVVTLLLWLAGYAVASITGWLMERRVGI
jgi:uncharacterized membrane protein required for colicin V production